MMNKVALWAVLAGSLSVAACTNPYDPGQRALGGGLLGAGAGAGLGAIAGGGQGAAIGALAGGALGALGGVATTPQAPQYQQGYQNGYGQPVYQQQPAYQQPAPGYYQPRYGY